jgi:xanthine dehydrogenase accessory factor
VGAVNIVAELAAAVERGEPVVVATVVRTNRSVPRHAGSKMLVYGDGRTSGTVGGGEMESRVRETAAAALADGRPRYLTYQLLDPASGDPGVCGGEVDLFLEPHMPTATVFVVGAGHVGKAVAELAGWMGYRTVVWDDRPEVLESIEAADQTLGASIDAAIGAATVDGRTSIVMVTRNVALDVEILPPLLDTDAAYIGVMGSRRRWQTTRQKLVDAGLDETGLDRVHSPIGIEINAETPEEIAVSIMAEVIEHTRTNESGD